MRVRKEIFPLELKGESCYIVHKKSTHSKVDAPEKNGYLPLSERRPFRLPTGWALFFSLVSLIEKGKQCHNQTTKGYQQANNPYKYQIVPEI
jgi:hypothetical protein